MTFEWLLYFPTKILLLVGQEIQWWVPNKYKNIITWLHSSPCDFMHINNFVLIHFKTDLTWFNWATIQISYFPFLLIKGRVNKINKLFLQLLFQILHHKNMDSIMITRVIMGSETLGSSQSPSRINNPPDAAEYRLPQSVGQGLVCSIALCGHYVKENKTWLQYREMLELVNSSISC